MTIDYAQQQICLRHPDLPPPAPSRAGISLPLHFYEHFPALADLCLDDQVQLPLATIDTGSNGALTLSPDLAQRVGLHPKADQVGVGTGHGFTQSCTITRSSADLQLGPLHLPAVEIDAPHLQHGDLSRHGRANLGNRLLGRFRSVSLDYRRALAIFEAAQ
jgi:glycine/D-amino acid oxidase-like deaminating enzyme